MELVYKKQNVFLYKFMPCLLFFMIAVMCLFGSYVQADNETDNSIHFSNFNSDYTSSSESSVTFSGFEPNFLNDENDFILLGCNSSSQFYAFYYNSSLVKPVVMYVSHESKYLVRFFDISTTNYTDNGFGATGSNYKTNIHKETIYVTANYVDGYISSYTYNSSDSSSYTGAGEVAGVRFLSSGDIIDTSNNVVFLAPPQQVEAMGIIAEKTQGVEMDKTLAEIVGILPVILLTIVGILAVRKAILFLIARMKRA